MIREVCTKYSNLYVEKKETGEISISNLGKFDFLYFSTWLAAFGICRLSFPPHVNLSRKGSAGSSADSWSWYDYSRVDSFLIQVIGTIVPQPGAEQNHPRENEEKRRHAETSHAGAS